MDTAAALERFSAAELIALARRLDPGLEGRDFAEAAQRLDQMPDHAFTAFGLTQQDVARLRHRFTAWPRDVGVAGESERDTGTGRRSHDTAGDEPARARGEREAVQPGGHRDVPHAEPEEPEIEP